MQEDATGVNDGERRCGMLLPSHEYHFHIFHNYTCNGIMIRSSYDIG